MATQLRSLNAKINLTYITIHKKWLWKEMVTDIVIYKPDKYSDPPNPILH